VDRPHLLFFNHPHRRRGAGAGHFRCRRPGGCQGPRTRPSQEFRAWQRPDDTHRRSWAAYCCSSGRIGPGAVAFRPGQIWQQFVLLPLDFCGEGVQVQTPLHLGKLKGQGRLNAVVPGSLIHIVDNISHRRFLIEAGAAYSIFPHRSPSAPTGPCLTGAASQPIPCWGEKAFTLSFHGKQF